MHPQFGVLFDAIIETVRLPSFREEHQRNCLSKVVHLQATGANCVHYGCIMNHPCWDFESPGSKDDVCVRGRTSYNQISTPFAKQPFLTQMDHRQQVKKHFPYPHRVKSRRSLIRPSRDRPKSNLSRRKLPCAQYCQEYVDRSLEEIQTRRSFWTIKMLVYASRYTREEPCTA